MASWKSLATGVAVSVAVLAASAAVYRHVAESRGRAALMPSLVASSPSVAPRRALVADPLAEVMEFNRGDRFDTPARAVKAGDMRDRGTFTVVLKDVPVASYQGTVPGIPAPRLAKSRGGVMRKDMRSDGAVAYARHLQQRQVQFERKAAGMVGRRIGVRLRMQHAISAVVVDLSTAEVERLRALPEVAFVEPYVEHPLHTDTGPALIGAPALWDNTSPFVPASYKGEGVVVGIIDSGINFGSPSFAAVGPVDGYVHVNPLGPGNYFGTCVPAGIDAGRCNNKLIGGYDFVCNAPGNQCGVADVREEPGFGDTGSHGSHVASTVAGNVRDAVFGGGVRRISGVAPRANIVAYDVCYTRISTGQGLCPSSSSTAAINQAVADGIVDVLNFSIGGGTTPWTDSVSLAFLSAVNSGIYVAASAGNSGPNPDTLSHLQPWVVSTAAAQHGSAGLGMEMNITGPAPVPAGLVAFNVVEGTGGTPHASEIPGTTPLRISPGINAADDGCNAFPAGTFTNAIAVIRRGTCNFTVKVSNAAAVGAIAVVIANNQAGSVTPSVPGAIIPVFSATQALGDQVRDFGLANPTATARIAFPSVRLANTPDVLASFSSRGPAATFSVVKPDITAPGVDVLAVMSGTTLTGSEQLVGLMSGTSMASPHHAGAAALMRQAHPAWTPVEIRSALQMTATTSVRIEDGVTLASPFAMGSGRVRLERAVRAGLVMHETQANFNAANPATGGQEWTLNLPSMARQNCTSSCTFTRTFRNPTPSGILWRASVSGVTGSVSPALVWIPAGATQSFTVTVDTTGVPADGNWVHGRVLLEHRVTGGGVDTFRELGLPVSVRVPPV
jgi:subtilisin family serine protease